MDQKVVVDIHNRILLINKRNESMSFAVIRMDLKGIMLSDKNQKTNTLWHHLYLNTEKQQKGSEKANPQN